MLCLLAYIYLCVSVCVRALIIFANGMSVRNLFFVLHIRITMKKMPFILHSKISTTTTPTITKTPLKVYLKEHITNGAVGNKFCMQLARARFHI